MCDAETRELLTQLRINQNFILTELREDKEHREQIYSRLGEVERIISRFTGFWAGVVFITSITAAVLGAAAHWLVSSGRLQ